MGGFLATYSIQRQVGGLNTLQQAHHACCCVCHAVAAGPVPFDLVATGAYDQSLFLWRNSSIPGVDLQARLPYRCARGPGLRVRARIRANTESDAGRKYSGRAWR